MQCVTRILRAPGAKHAVKCAAPTQQVVADVGQDDQVDFVNVAIAPSDEDIYSVSRKSGLLDRWLDKIVKFSGSEVVFFLILTLLLAWAFMGIMFGKSTDWQVGISDAQAIINLVFDSFLMRQQLNSYDRTLTVIACLRSRTISHQRMLRKLIASEKYSHRCQDSEEDTVKLSTMQPERELEEQTNLSPTLPAENLLGRTCTHVSNFLGHIVLVSLFWVGILIWVGFGAYCHWSSTWLLYINSATSALMVFVLAFLANIRERHGEYSKRCVNEIYKVDTQLELHLRAATGDTEPNPVFTVPAPEVGRIQRVIDYYADLVGALIGIAILILTMIVWVVIGPALGFNANWWLLIGTYAGLVGMNDGFVLRNVCNKLGGYETPHFEQIAYEDLDALATLNAHPSQQRQLTEKVAEERQMPDSSLSTRVSIRMGNVCSHELTVVFGVVLILGLVVGASAMGWSLTAQLLCNVPPSIIETFFMMVLITGHNLGDRRRRVDLADIHRRRLSLLRGVQAVVGSG